MTHFVQPTKYAAIGMIRKIKGLKGEMVVSLTYPKVRLEDDRFFFFLPVSYLCALSSG